MRKQLIFSAISFFVLSAFCLNSQALELEAPDSLWIRTFAPSSFTGMTFFQGILDITDGADMDYHVYGPEGYSRPIYDSPYGFVDLTPFYGEQVLFELRAINGTITFKDEAAVWDCGIPGGWCGFTDSPFYFGFYDIGDSGDLMQDWLDREVIDYYQGEILASEPSHGDLFYSHPLGGGLRPNANVRSDFIHADPVSDVDIDPDTLNLKSEGVPITVYIGLPEGYNVEDIDVSSIRLEEQDELAVELSDIQDGVLMIKFNRQDVIDYLESIIGASGIELPADVTLKITGELIGGPSFEGQDTIRVINP